MRNERNLYNMSNIDNPFLIYGYEGPDYFCDREYETSEIIEALQNGCNMTVMSPRRYGKTGLIHNAFYRMSESNPDVCCFYMDVFATHSLQDFVKLFGRTVIGKLDTPLQKAEGFVQRFFHSAQLTLGIDPLSNMPQIGLNFQPQQTESTLDEIFAYIAQSDRKCYIAIDEFQQVADYPEKNVEELLRTFVQRTHNVHFVFSGSRLHVMSAMFSSPRHPFYRSTERLHLDILPENRYYEFAAGKLKNRGISISKDVFHHIYEITDGVTWYVQRILNVLYRRKYVNVDNLLVENITRSIVLGEEEDYKQMVRLLTSGQMQLLDAIAKEVVVKEPTSNLFLRKYNLKAPSSVQRSLKFLLEHEYIYQQDDGYIVYDRFMAMWLKNK